MGFTGIGAAQWKEKYIAAFEAMEERLKVGAGGTADEPIFHVTAKELDALVEKRVKDTWLGKIALDALPRKRLDAEWDEYNLLLSEAGKLALAADYFIKAAEHMVDHIVLANECMGQVRTLRARAVERRDAVYAEPKAATALVR